MRHGNPADIQRREVLDPGNIGRVVRKLLRALGKSALEDRRLRLIETLPMGGRRQLLLVELDGRAFLAGGNVDSIHTLVAVNERSNSPGDRHGEMHEGLR